MEIVKYIGENPWHCTLGKEIVVEVPAEQDGKVLTDDQVKEIESYSLLTYAATFAYFGIASWYSDVD